MSEIEPAALARLQAVAAGQPYPLVFATVSGAHLYGFPSPDSDYDLRGVHVLPVEEVVGLDDGPSTLEVSEVRDGLELDLVTHDVGKFAELLLRRNGYVLEQVCSPLVVAGGDAHDELRAIAATCVTRHHAFHYLGFASTQWRLFEKERRVKPLLYTFRVLKTGIHLMRTGEVQADLTRLLDEPPVVPYLSDLVDRKRDAGERSGDEQDPAVVARYEADVARLRAELEAARDASHLPDSTAARPALHEYVVRQRLLG